jgi:two-component system nitrate/nitrite response regulator NarL
MIYMARLPINEANVVTVLTNRERQIMRLASEGLANKEIGRRLSIADRTLRIHFRNMLQKLEIGTEPRSRRSP